MSEASMNPPHASRSGKQRMAADSMHHFPSSPAMQARPRLAPLPRIIRRLALLSAGVMLAPVSHAGVLDGPQPVESRLSGLGHGQSDFGGVGLMQTPTARMQKPGSIHFSYSQVEPYQRYNVSLQPLDWLEVGFRYTEVTNRLYGESIAGDRDYLDKGVDAKIRLWEESRYLPQLAVGLRDMGGTSLFGSEYLVASKRWYDLDFTLGLGWGYLGSRGDLSNPIGWIRDSYNDRPGRGETGGDQGGEFSLNSLFKGDMGVFGGVEWQTPWDPLVMMVELDGNDYQSEPQDNDQAQDSPINLGARLSVTDNLTLKAGWERGNTAMLGVNFGVDLAGLSQAKLDRPPEALQAEAPSRNQVSWPELSREIQAQSGIRVDSLSREGTALIVSGESTRFRSTAQAEGRATAYCTTAWMTISRASITACAPAAWIPAKMSTSVPISSTPVTTPASSCAIPMASMRWPPPNPTVTRHKVPRATRVRRYCSRIPMIAGAPASPPASTRTSAARMAISIKPICAAPPPGVPIATAGSPARRS